MTKLTGRELDVEIARVVFGYEVEKQNFWKPSTLGETLVRHTDLYIYSNDGSKHTWEVIPRYSTDMGAAWQVAEWIREHKSANDFALTFYKHIGGITWGCTISDLMGGVDIEVEADTAQEAICYAALELYGGDDE